MIEDVIFANHMYTKISDLKFNNIEKEIIDEPKKYTDLEYLQYEETNKVKKKKKKKNNDHNKELRLYILVFIIFCFLNSYFVINLINSYGIQYSLSLFIRAVSFIFLYYIITKCF